MNFKKSGAGLCLLNHSSVICVQAFVAWLRQQPAPFIQYDEQLAAAGDPSGDQSFAAKWLSIGSIDSFGFAKRQDDYAKSVYF